MRVTRLAATGFAAGAMVLGMAGPALATPDADKPEVGAPCAEIGKEVKLPGGAKLVCQKGDNGKGQWALVKPDKPSPTPTPTKPTFKFGYDDVKLSSRSVAPGKKTTFTVTCPSAVSITSNGYTQSPLTVKKAGKNTWTATGTFKSNLPDPTVATVVCKGFGSVKFSTSPEKGDNNMTPKTPKVPTGPINTGDGTMYAQSNGSTPLMAAGFGAVMVAGLGAFALRRRTVRERS